MGNVPRTKVGSKKSKYSMLLEQFEELQHEVRELRQGLGPIIEREVERNLGDKIAMIDGALTETILQKEVLIDLGIVTRDQINAKYEELRARGGK
jgi:hypothetical protein